MIYALGAIRRRSDLSFDAFADYWRTIHRDIVLEFARPGPIEGYVQNHRVQDLPAGIACDFDGVVELWIRDAQALAELGASARFQYASNEDSARFIEMPAITSLLSDLQFETGRSRKDVSGMIRMIQYMKRPNGPEYMAFDEAWLNQDTPLSLPDSVPFRLTRQMFLPVNGEAHPSGFFGIESSWWPNAEILSEAWTGRLSLAGSATMVAREEVALEPPSHPQMTAPC